MKKTAGDRRFWELCGATATLLCALALSVPARGQGMPYARTFAKSRTEVDQALKEMGAYAGQKLPIVDGFVASTAKPLVRYERAFYQLDIQLFPGTGGRGGTIAQVTAKITAWYADADPSKSGYEVLPSNGRLEFDLLDRLDEKLGTAPAGASRATSSAGVSAPKAKLDLSGVPGVSQLAVNQPTTGTRTSDELADTRAKREEQERRERALSGQLQTLQDIQKNQAHPLNLVAVKKSGTPVMARAAEGSRVLFLAAAGDEFEYLDAAGPWLHVGISGVSRGYIKRGSVELTDFIVSRLKSQDAAEASAKPVPFRVEREELSLFPGDWESLKGKKVKIYTVQPGSQVAKETDAAAKLAFAASLFENFSLDATAPVEGVVVIFDSADGGIIGATLGNVQQLAEATLSKENFFKQCYLDPPDAFSAPGKP